ncbi:tRNA (N(6)-L-threonylcarbamoyladenosine(37)-C(2))-methylthiotransferase MtaB [uncultured Desulfosarcina sp.]|uniref:tRNA (N(6)-L-threonylcarbamoyladenosine(37)-C(2))- methylthiotransferase MtaB n=1 Tax=uncultured Desulfosarcina sp. TaxID=218289 RepID=UPI0029C9416E|nr:tRNA (N(6)-L-threonylcarbamoyladenosine(37)-C(2))-methylthiotransferase MtaB [uncultured Desulfosarcina sp.]
MKKLVIKTLGCKVNQCESESICNALLESGQGFTCDESGEAEVVIINTCTVTSKAAMQSRQAVRQAIRANPGARIVVTGCHAQMAPEELAAIEGVDLVVGNRDKHQISNEILSGLGKNRDRIAPVKCPDVAGPAQFEMLPGIAHGGRTRPFIKIQDGCNAFCTYCIVPHARGRSRSLPMEQVLDQVVSLAKLGNREVVLTGIHIGCYGQDLNPETSLYELLCQIRQAGAIDRVRVSSIEPAELSDAIIDLAVTDKKMPGRLCRHFHIPLQSGDDGILNRMHRPYGRDDFSILVKKIIDRVPDAAIGVDTLIGFPGETDAAFDQTYDLIASLPVAYLHVFPFSARNGTPAYSYENQVPVQTIKERCQRMRKLGAQKRRSFYERHVGRTVTVLVEETREKKDGRLKGLTDNYIPVLFDGPDELTNTFQQVEIQGVSADGVPEGRAL